MDDKTAKALEASITHWSQHSLAATSAQAVPPDYHAVLGGECALCVQFAGASCTGCPIKAKEQEKWEADGDAWEGCDGSPWGAARRAATNWRRDTTDHNRAMFSAAAQRMTGYLINLRPENWRDFI